MDLHKNLLAGFENQSDVTVGTANTSRLEVRESPKQRIMKVTPGTLEFVCGWLPRRD